MKLKHIFCKHCGSETQHRQYSDTSTEDKVFLFPILPIVLAMEQKYWVCLKCNNKIK